ncbi:unnamed protein product [marine sediment metagenome]|uniref:FMN-binding domain-containing protein n=1 Tax=marine sediment metagenome TaxID=412755 RepID=X0UEW2_9ZZZZ
MRKSIRMILVLAIVGFVSGGSLALVYKYALPQIEFNQKKELDAAIFKVFSQGKEYEVITEEDETFFKVLDKRKNLLGYAFIAEGNGYQGVIKLMVGIKSDLNTLSGMEVLESVETPGLGGEITNQDFKKQFVNLRTIPEIVCVKTKPTKSNEIQAITAATISSKSVVNIINERIEKIRNLLKR